MNQINKDDFKNLSEINKFYLEKIREVLSKQTNIKGYEIFLNNILKELEKNKNNFNKLI